MCATTDDHSSEQVIRQGMYNTAGKLLQHLLKERGRVKELMDLGIAQLKEATAINQESEQLVTEHLQSLEGEDQRWTATVIYWQTDFIREEVIAEGVGLPSHDDLPGWICPAGFESICEDCGETFSFSITLRTELREMEKGIGIPERCEQCQKKHLRTMPYNEYLKTKHWQTIRRGALERAKYRCQVCNTNQVTLHVHHRTYENRGRELPEDVIVLCANCHRAFHEFGQLAG